MKAFQIQGFGGAFSAIDPREITPFNGALKLLNVRIEDKSITPRFGYRSLASAQANFGTPYGLVYLSGYTGSQVFTEEFVSFESISGTVRPFSRNAVTGAVTNIRTPVPAQPSLNASDWVGRAFGSFAYFANANETSSVVKYTLGSPDTWTPLQIPVAPTAALTYSVLYGGGSLAAYSTRAWDAVVTANVTYTGVGTATGFAANANGTLTLGTSVAGTGSFTIDMKAASGINANQDWTSNDIFYFTLQGEPGAGNGSYAFDTSSFGVQLVNDDGSPVTFNSVQLDCRIISPQVGTTPAVYGIRVEFDKANRALWVNIRKVVVSFWVNSNSGAKMRMSAWTRGGVWISASRNPVLPRDVLFSYSYYYSANLWESGLCPTALTVPFAVLQGFQPLPNVIGLGVHLRLTFTTSGDPNVDNNRLYVYDTQNNLYRLVVTQAKATTTYDYKLCYNESHALTSYLNVSPFKTDQCVNLCPFKSWIVWFYKGPDQSIRHSRTDNPERQHSDLDDPLTDIYFVRGATFSMPGFNDEPLGGVAAGDILLIAGSIGVYAQVGVAPSGMTPPKKVDGSFGVANKQAFTAWKDDAGNEGMAYLSTSGQVRFAEADPSFTGDTGSRDYLLSTAIQTGAMSPATFLRDGQGLTDFSTARIFIDQYTDSLWVVMKNNALVLRRPHPETGGARQWEAYTYTANLSYASASTKRWLKVLASDGSFIELERNSATGANITGTLRDAGTAIASLYWQSGTFTMPNSRVKRVRVERDTWSNRPTVTIVSDRQTSSVQAAMGAPWIDFDALQQGNNHVIKVALSENDDPVRRIECILFAAGSRYLARYA